SVERDSPGPPRSDNQPREVPARAGARGLAPAVPPRLFTPFFSRRKGGFGLGLAISHRIIDEHNWRLTAANGSAGGAVMTVVVPLNLQRERTSPAEESAHPGCRIAGSSSTTSPARGWPGRR